jgi:Kinesin motor domain
VKDLTCCIVKSIPEIEKLMNFGSSQRKVGETAMNKDSSRSHSIFTIYIETSEDVTPFHILFFFRPEMVNRVLKQENLTSWIWPAQNVNPRPKPRASA